MNAVVIPKSLVLLGISLSMLFNSFGQSELSVNRPGRYASGYTNLFVTDSSRTGWQNNFREITIFLWYPSQPQVTNMKLKDYYVPYKDRLNVLLSKFKSDTSKLDNILNIPCHASHNAEMSDGQFPVIFYASGFRSIPLENIALFEWLSTQGYIIAAVSSKGKDTSEITMDNDGVLTQYKDLETAFLFIKKTFSQNSTHFVSMGFSMGAVPAAMLALSKPDVKAFVSIDGGMFYTYNLLTEQLTAATDYNQNIPTLNLFQRRFTTTPVDSSFYNILMRGKSYWVQFEKLDHYDMAFLTLLFKSIRPSSYKPDNLETNFTGNANTHPYISRFNLYDIMCNMIIDFLDCNLNRGNSFSEFLLKKYSGKNIQISTGERN